MRGRFGLTALALALGAGLTAGIATAQDTEEGGGWFVSFVESLVSTPDRKVRILGLDGIFSANPKIGRVTVADGEGVWLELDDVALQWDRAKLFDRVIKIDDLKAARVAMLREPEAAEKTESSGGGLSAPPLAIEIDKISLPKIELAQPVAGVAAELTAQGSARLTADVLAANLHVDRQDRAGTLALDLRLEPQANVLTAELKLDEPADGLVAELLELRGRPAVTLTVSGTGPLNQWGGTMEMLADGRRVLAGGMSIARTEDAYKIAADLTAALQSVVPVDYSGLLAGQSRLTFDLSRGDDGSLTVRSAKLSSEGVDLTAKAVVGPDMVPQSADVSLSLGQAGRAALPFAPGNVSVASLSATLGLDSGDDAPWRATVNAAGVEGEFGNVGALKLEASGQARNLARASQRGTSFRFDAAVDGIAPRDPGLGSALGPTLKANGSGSWSNGRPVDFEALNLVLNGATANFKGTAGGEGINGDFAASIIDIVRFSGLAGRSLKGRVELAATGTATTKGAFDLRLDGTGSGLALGVGGLDPLLAGDTKLAGGVARDGETIRFDDLAVTNRQVTANLNGTLSDPKIDMAVTASVADLSLVTPRASGAVELTARVTGPRDAPQVDAEATGEEVVLMDRPLSGATAKFSGIVSGPSTSGEASISGRLGEAPVKGSARLAAAEGGARTLKDLRFTVGESQVTGNLALGADGLVSGNLSVVSPDLSKIAPLFLVDASGMLRAEIALSAENGAQSAVFSGTATDVEYETVTLGSAEIDGRASDLFHAPEIDGDFALNDLNAGGLRIVSAKGNAKRAGEATAFSVDATLADGRAKVAGDLKPQDGGMAVGLNDFFYQRPGIDVSLAQPTTIAVRDGGARFEKATLRAGSGSVTISGDAGKTLNIDVTLNSVPAALANAASPGLGAEGTISGVVRARGAASDPKADFELTLAGASVAASRNAGIGALGVSARGGLANKELDLSSEIFGPNGMSLQVGGKVGTAKGAPLALKVTGGVPLALGNQQLASRGAALKGVLDVNIAVSGTADNPRFSGRVSSEGGGFVDPESGIVLSDLSMLANVSGDRVVLERLNAKSGEGTVAANGTIGLDPNAGFPVDLSVKVNNARYVDGTMIAARFDADLTMRGNFAEGPLLEGSVDLHRTEVTVPETLPKDSVAVDVEHVAPPKPVEQTLAALRQPSQKAGGGTGSGGIRLAVDVRAPQRIFIRGRGLDAEFGGNLKLSGATDALTASGGFDMVRGRLDVLTKRIAFDRGVITFAGDLDPLLDFSGSTRSGDTTITVAVTGRASDPQVTFSSVPDLPQDEILAQLIFQKGITELSPLQVARLAAAVSELSGGSGGLLAQLRATTGLDDLDIVTDEEGQTSVAAGRYVTENVYIGVQQGATADTSRVTIDLDVTKNLKARAGVTAQGGSSLGLFFEKEY